MATASVPNGNFVNGTSADADEVDANFAALVSFLNGSVVHRDGSKAMTAAFDAGSNKIVNLSTGTASTDAVNLGQLTAAASALPLGKVAYASVTANQGGITDASTDLTSLTGTWTATSTRLYRITVVGAVVSTVGSDVAALIIANSANTVYQQAQHFLPSSGVTSTYVAASVIVTGLSGAQTFKARLARVSGSGTLQFSAAATSPAQFIVEDLGIA